MLEGMGIETGVDLDKIIDCVWLLERIIGTCVQTADAIRWIQGALHSAAPQETRPKPAPSNRSIPRNRSAFLASVRRIISMRSFYRI